MRSGERPLCRRCAVRALAALLAGLLGGGAAPAAAAEADSTRSAAWKTLRAVDCARCHGKDYEGLAAPSIVEYARTQSREMFVRAVLDGDPGRGMPGYRSNPRVLEGIDDLYGYFLDRGRDAPAR